jgi:hypothetical protein
MDRIQWVAWDRLAIDIADRKHAHRNFRLTLALAPGSLTHWRVMAVDIHDLRRPQASGRMAFDRPVMR